MIYFFYDPNKSKGIVKARKLFEDLRKKKPDATFLEFDSQTATTEKLFEALQSQGLFESKVVAYLKEITEQDDVADTLKKLVSEMAKSDSIFVWYESDLKKTELELLTKHAEKFFIEEEKKGRRKEFNTFSLAESFASKDKKNFWKGLLEAKREGIAAEEVHGILWWQLKSIIVADDSKTASESGLKPFVYTKSKSFAKKFTSEELKDLVDQFVSMYHKAHRGEVDLYDALEEMALKN